MDGLLKILKGLGAGRLMVFGAILVGGVIFFTSVIGELNRAPLVTLYTELEPSQANEIVQRLQQHG